MRPLADITGGSAGGNRASRTRRVLDHRAAERRRRQLADAFAAGRISEHGLIDEMAKVRTETAADGDAFQARPVDVGRAMAYIRNFAASWVKAQPRTRVAMIQSADAEIVVRGEEFVSVRLTPDLRRSLRPRSRVRRSGLPDGQSDMWRQEGEVTVGREHDEVVANAQLSEQHIDRADLDPTTAADVP